MFCREPDFAERAAYGKGPFCRRAFFAERSSRQNGPLRRELLLAEMQAHGNPVTCRRPMFAESRARQTFSLPRGHIFALGKNLGSRQRMFSGSGDVITPIRSRRGAVSDGKSTAASAPPDVYAAAGLPCFSFSDALHHRHGHGRIILLQAPTVRDLLHLSPSLSLSRSML